MRRLQSLFHEAIELAPAERPAFLDEACGADAVLRAEIEELLAHDRGQGDEALISRVLPVAQSAVSTTAAGQQIGGYRLLREIGSGGMGTVFLAERDDREFRHQVALKLVRGFPTQAVLDRFRRERELLASLRHPNIARLFDGGTTDAGQPYLVMEFVDGIPLDAWCREQRPGLRTRLRLFQSLCSAVQHAHQQLIVHRDLKPANVLVRRDGEPVLLDFGIGTLLGAEEDARVTRLAALTPAYASPEQLAGLPVTTLSDIYGLGLILFELLTGTPLRGHRGDTASRTAPSAVAAKAEPWLRQDARTLRGDLDTIVRKALHEAPARRYQNAAELSADIDRFFEGRPVLAAPDSLAYRTRKFVTRHPLALTATTATIVLLAGLSLRLAQERDRALQAQAQARIEAAGADQSAQFLVDLFGSAAPDATRGEELSVRTLVARAEAGLAAREFSRPEIKARMEAALGEIHHGLGAPQQGIALLEQALGRLPAEGVDGDPRVRIRILSALARAYDGGTRIEASLAAGREALALAREHLPPGDLDLGHALQISGVAEEKSGNSEVAAGHFAEARVLFAAAGPDHRDSEAAALHNQGWSAAHRGEHGLARDLLTEAMTMKEAVVGRVHPTTLVSAQMLARSQYALGDTEAALAGMRAVLADQIALVGEPSQHVAILHSEIGSILQDAGRNGQARAHYQAAIDQYRQLGDTGSADQAIALNNLASLLEQEESFPEAVDLYRRALAMRQAAGAQARAIARGHHNLARVLLALGDPASAREHASAAWATRQAFSPAAEPEHLDTLLLLAQLADAAGDAPEAARRFAAYDAAIEGLDLDAVRRARALDAWATRAVRVNDTAAAIEHRRALVALLVAGLPPAHPQLGRARLHLAALLEPGTTRARTEARSLVELAREPVLAGYDPAGPTRALLSALSRP